uniref:Serpentine receptor class gamma n=1 Tax=Meloidogyne hapla TaxID=6305 RepID=A0A1I8C1B6_MELHA
MNTTWIFNFFNTLSQSVIPPNIIALLIVIPSAILYITELGIIFNFKKTFKSSFFKLFVARTISSILGLISQCLYIRFGRVGFFLSIYLKLPGIYLAIFNFMTNHFFFVENMSTAMLLINRLTALLWPLKYERIWKKLWVWSIILLYILPLPLTWHCFFSEVVVWVHDDNKTFTLFTQMKPDDLNDPLITSWFSMFFTIICLVINLGCLFVYKRTKIISSQQTESKQKMETRLTIYSLLTFCGQLLYSVYMIILYISAFQLQNLIDTDLAELIFLAVFNQLAWVNDICTIAIPSFLLLWASELMNSHIYSLIRIICFLPKENNNAVMVIPKQAFTSSTTQKQTK